MRALFLAMALTGSAAYAFAAPTPAATIDAAFARMGPNSTDGWAFTKTTVSNSAGTMVERFDPQQPAASRWTLVSVNGQPPAKKALQDYAKGAKLANTGQDNRKLRATIKDASLVKVSEDAQRIVYGFQAKATDPKDKFTGHLDGQIVISKAGPYVESYKLVSRKPFSPMIGANVQQFVNEVRFAPVGDTGAVFFSRIQIIVKGRLIGVKNIDDTVTNTFSHYRQVARR